MIKIVVKKKIKEGKIDEAIKLYQELVLASQKKRDAFSTIYIRIMMMKTYYL